jgi:autotransporter translocation and assembly factor TamB
MSEIYRDVSFEGTFSQNVLTLKNIKGREGAKGTFEGQGSVTFNGLELETFAIDFVADRFLVASIPDLRVLVRSQDIRLSGVKVGPDSLIVPKFTGQAEVIKGRYTGQFAESSGVSDPLAATLAPDWMADVHAVAPPRTVRVVNRAMELYMSGDVDLIRDERGLYLRGSMDLDAGRFPVFNNDFNVVRGSLDFSQDVGLVPRVDMVAETKVRVRSALDPSSRLERITVYATGRIDEPTVTFSSESGYSREGIERMLMGLSPYATEAQPYSGLRGASIAAGFNLLEREIATGLNVIDTFDIEQVERTQDGGANVSPLIGVGKYLGQDLYIKYAQGLSQSDRDLLIEYQINNHLLLQSEVRRRIDEQQGDTTYNLDLMYRFEY